MIKLKCIVILLAFTLSGCGTSKPSNFYILSDLGSHRTQLVSKTTRSVIGVGPITFAKYLNQPQIVTRNSLNQIKLDEFNRWAEPLADNFTRVLSKDLNATLKNHSVVVYPSANFESIQYQVTMSVDRFDATTEGKVIAEVSWVILNKVSGKRLISSAKSYVDFIGQPFSYAQLANCLSRVTARIANAIAHDFTKAP
jgi:uncharacterized protein